METLQNNPAPTVGPIIEEPPYTDLPCDHVWEYSGENERFECECGAVSYDVPEGYKVQRDTEDGIGSHDLAYGVRS